MIWLFVWDFRLGAEAPRNKISFLPPPPSFNEMRRLHTGYALIAFVNTFESCHDAVMDRKWFSIREQRSHDDVYGFHIR